MLILKSEIQMIHFGKLSIIRPPDEIVSTSVANRNSDIPHHMFPMFDSASSFNNIRMKI